MTSTADAQLCREILNSSLEAIVAVDLKRTVLTWNRTAEELFGIAAKSIVGQPLPKWASPKSVDDENLILSSLAESGQTARFTAERQHSDGSTFRASITIALLRNSQGQPMGFCFYIRPERAGLGFWSATNEERLQRAHRLAKLGFWELDGKTSEVVWSPELYRMFDLDPDKDKPLNLSEQSQTFSPESWSTIQDAIEDALRTGKPYEHELQYTSRSGRTRWMLARGEALLAEDGTIEGLCGTAVDITQLKATQRELELSRERLSLATAAAKFGVWDIDLSTGTLVWDDMMHVHFGTDPKKFRGRFEDWSERVHPEDLPAAESAFREALDGGDDFDTVFRVCRPNGSIAYLGGKAIVHFRHGKAYRVVGVNWDMTEQREAELTLKANENLLRDFVRHAPAAIAMLDKNLCYLQTSDRWLKDYGLDGEDLTGRPHYEVFPDQPERWKAIHQEALRGKVQACSEDPFPRADGRCEWLQWEVRPWYDAYGLVGGVIFFTQVITQRKEMELRLEVQRNELQRSNKDLEQFAYAASHDLQEPLRAVSGCAQLLRDRYEEQLDPMGFELIAHIVEGADRMKTLISDLLTYSRVNNGDPFTNVDTEQVLQDVLALLRDSISESGATICHDRLPTVTGAYSQLRQLFQNLIGNAIKYRAERPLELKISVAEHNSSHWRFSFADNGIGIEPRHLRRIFGIFQRLHTRLEYPGTGIGLALCQKIVTRHGGRLWVDSALGRGATFKFTILKGESHERQ